MVVTPADDECPVRAVLLGPDLAARRRLRDGLTNCGLDILGESSVSAFSRSLAQGADVLLVCLEGADDAELDALDRVSEERAEPMVFFEGAALDDRTIARLSEKLRIAAGESRRALGHTPAPATLSEPDARPAEGLPVWVLGASFGGPQALSAFLAAMPTPPPAAFIVAQHIGDGFAEVLAQQLHRSTKLNVVCAAPGMPVNPGRVYVAPIRSRLVIDERDRFKLGGDYEGESAYVPNIDEIMMTVARRYGDLSGAIVFSGMASDGAQGAGAVRAAGGTVWAQDAASSTVASMPDEAAARGAVSYRAAPETLATELSTSLEAQAKNHWPEQTA